MMKLRIGIVGATGIVGTELISILEDQKWPISKLLLLASERSDGKKIKFDDCDITVESLTDGKLRALDYVFFCSDSNISRKYVPLAAERGICCIDNSSAFRLNSDVPLVVPEINPDALKNHHNIISNPNCSTIIALVALFPLHKVFGLSGFTVSTYQAVSGVGATGITALEQDIIGDFGASTEVFGEQIFNNAIPKIGDFNDDGYTSEEVKMANESRKILNLPSLRISSTCVRIPVIRAHSMSIVAQFNKKLNFTIAEEILSNCDDVEYYHGASFATPLRQSKKDKVAISRLRMDTFLDNAINLWVVGDQIRKGAAQNAVQIMHAIESLKNGAQEGIRTPTSCDTAA